MSHAVDILCACHRPSACTHSPFAACGSSQQG